MTSEGRDRSNRWLQNPVWWIGSVALLGLVIAGVFGIRSLVVSSGEGTTGSGEGTALAARTGEERAGVEGDESPVDSADGIAPDDRPDEEISVPPVPPEGTAESNGPGSPEAEESGEPPAPVTTTAESSAADLAEESDEIGGPPITETEEVDGQPAPATTTIEPGDVIVGESNETESWDELGSPMYTGWIVPWDDGFLEVGWPQTGETRNNDPVYDDESHLKARALSDNQHCRNIQSLARASRIPNCWEDLDHYLTPNGGESIRAVISDGARMIVASETTERVYISISSDLKDWNTTEIILPHPPSLPDFVYTFSYMDHLAMGPNGWLLKITTEFTIDILGLAGIRELEAKLSAADLKDEVNRLIGITDVYFDEDGVELTFRPDDKGSEYMTRELMWDELGINKNEFRKYYARQTMKPYIFSDNILGSAWVTMWGEDPVRVDLPDISGHGTCCSIIGTEAGYIAFSDPSEPGYMPTRWGPGVAFFSFDGYIWTPIESPSAVFFDVWPVENGLIVSGALLEAYEEDGRMKWTNWDWDRPLFWWSVNSDGSNWQEIKMPPSGCGYPLKCHNNPTIRLRVTR